MKMRSIGYRWILVIVATFFTGLVHAQCAMCRGQLETNVSNGDSVELASKLNIGILYLFALPYLMALVVGVIWYRSSKKRQAAKKRRIIFR